MEIMCNSEAAAFHNDAMEILHRHLAHYVVVPFIAMAALQHYRNVLNAKLKRRAEFLFLIQISFVELKG